MKKLLFGLVLSTFFCPFWAYATDAPTLDIQLAPGNLPTQRITPGTENVDLLRLWFTPSNHTHGGTVIQKLSLRHAGDDHDQFLRYKLMQNNRILSKVSLPASDTITFKNLTIPLTDETTTELRVLADTATHRYTGTHTFSLNHPDDVKLDKPDFRLPNTYITGYFPLQSNKIILAPSFDRPSPDCNLREEPVCGVDGKTYYNLCIPFQQGIEIDYDGPCYTTPVVPLEPCPDKEDPVCGDNGRTYKNQCIIDRLDHVTKEYDGQCFPDTFVSPTTFSQAVELFGLKANQLKQIRPKLDETTDLKLAEITAVLNNYPFTDYNQKKLTKILANFLDFSELQTDRLLLVQKINTLNKDIIDARNRSAYEKYDTGKIPFRDVDENAWYLQAVQFLKDKNMIDTFVDADDRTSGFFRPGYFVTKAEITQILFDLAGINPFVAPPAQNPFARNHWAYNTIAKAEELDLSLWADQPNPNQKTTRFEITQLILEIFAQEDEKNFHISSFKDVSDPEDIQTIEHAKYLKIIRGYADGSFRPKRLITRSEAAQIVLNAAKVFQ